MSRVGVVLTSLVAAVPGAALTVLVVMAFLKYADAMSGVLIGLSAVTLLASALIALLPVGIVLFSAKPRAATAAAAVEPTSKVSDEEDAADSVKTIRKEKKGKQAATMDGIVVEDDETAAVGDEDFDFGDMASAEDEEPAEDFDFDFDDEKKK